MNLKEIAELIHDASDDLKMWMEAVKDDDCFNARCIEDSIKLARELEEAATFIEENYL